MKRVFLTEKQLATVVTNIIQEGTGTDAIQPADTKKVKTQLAAKGAKPVKGPIKGGPTQTTSSFSPTGSGVGTDKGSPNQASDNTPNTIGSGTAIGVNDGFGPTFNSEMGYEQSITNNLDIKSPKAFDGQNPTYLPGEANDPGANLQLKGNFGVDGVTLATMSGNYDIKVGKEFQKQMKKGKQLKKSKEKHAELHPNRHKNSTPIKNIVGPSGIDRGGVSFDTGFKPGKGGDPFTVKTK